MTTAPAATRETVYRALAHQLEALRSQKKITALFAGVGAGKTEAGALWTLQRALEAPPGVRGILAANSYPQLLDSTAFALFRLWNDLGITFRPAERPRGYSPFNLEVWTGAHWSEVLCRSLGAYETLAGTEVGYIWIDEAYQAERAAFDLLIARLRDSRFPRRPLPLLLTTTKDEPDSWLYELFVEKFDADLMHVIEANTGDNTHLLPEYIETLAKLYAGPLYERMVGNQWVALVGQRIYYSFDASENVTEAAEFDPQLPLCWAHDFNIGAGKPMSSVLAQIGKGRGPDGKMRPELRVFDELILDSTDTGDAIAEFESRRWKDLARSGIRIYGDATGRARDTRSKTTDYMMLSAAGYTDQRVPRQNPPIRERHNAVNSLLRNAAGDRRLLIHPRCTTVAKGLTSVRLRDGAQYLELETREQHVTTALGYLVAREFPLVRPTGAVEMKW